MKNWWREGLSQSWLRNTTQVLVAVTWRWAHQSFSEIRVLLHFFIFGSVDYNYSNLTVHFTDVYNFLGWGNTEAKSIINTDLIWKDIKKKKKDSNSYYCMTVGTFPQEKFFLLENDFSNCLSNWNREILRGIVQPFQQGCSLFYFEAINLKEF